MKLNKPIITICIIILLIVNLIFFSFLSIGKKIGEKDFLNEIVLKFNLKTYILNNESISKSIEEYKYPKEVYNYLDNLKINNLKNKFINNLFEKKDRLIDKSDVEEILKNSVYEYEYNHSSDIYSYVENDIKEVSNHLEERFNSEFVDHYFSIKYFSEGIIYYVSILLTVALILLIIYFEKKNGLLITSIILLIYSFTLFYVNDNYLEFGLNNVFKYFDKIDFKLDNIYIICFILGFVLLLIYMCAFFKKVTREIRIKSYNRR